MNPPRHVPAPSREPATVDPTVFVIDDDPGVRKSLRLLLETVHLPVETYASAQEFMSACSPGRRGCIVLDLRMPGMSGLELQERLDALGCLMPIIFITAHGDVTTAVRAVKGGALHFLEKPFRGQELLDVVQEALLKNHRDREREERRQDAAARLRSLTPREREVCDLIVLGLPAKAVASELSMAKKTYDVHRAHVFRKMNVSSAVELVRVYGLALGEWPGRRPA